MIFFLWSLPVAHLTKDEHPPEFASSPVSCELLVYFLCDPEKEWD